MHPQLLLAGVTYSSEEHVLDFLAALHLPQSHMPHKHAKATQAAVSLGLRGVLITVLEEKGGAMEGLARCWASLTSLMRTDHFFCPLPRVVGKSMDI